MLKGSVGVQPLVVWAKGYFRENWGAPSALVFMVLLMLVAVRLAVGLVWWANQIAICSYYALVVSVILQLVCFLRTSDVEERQESK
jgi:heme/copper-type cytochrome/quinol oxidase subunit 4